MAKRVVTCTLSSEELNTLAQKFGAIPKNVRRTADIIVGGYLTEHECSQVQFCARSKQMESGTKWPEVAGRTLYPFSGMLTPEETEVYYQYKKSHVTGVSRATVNQGALAALRERIAGDKELLALLDQVTGHADSVKACNQLFGVNCVAELEGSVNMAYVMFTKDGKHPAELQPNAADLMAEGYEVTLKTSEVRALLKKAGIEPETGIITDLK